MQLSCTPVVSGLLAFRNHPFLLSVSQSMYPLAPQHPADLILFSNSQHLIP